MAWELLITGVVRRIAINDISRPLHEFWRAALNRTDELCSMIERAELSVTEWDRCKRAIMQPETVDNLTLAYSFFYLNRTNRSGILNGGIIGGREQTGAWKIDARFNKSELICRIRRIAAFRSRITLTCMDAIKFMSEYQKSWGRNTFVYADPPYYEKGRALYYDFYNHENHKQISKFMLDLANTNWIVSYDDVEQIRSFYRQAPSLTYSINYSARNPTRGREIMFFSAKLRIPAVIEPPLLEIERTPNQATNSAT